MRTTLTLEDDVAFALARLQRARGSRFKALVNEVLREGLKQMRARPTPGKRFQTESVDLGRPRLTGIDNVAEALALTEGEAFR